MRNTQQAIGIFDSGIGGLTVAKAVSDLLPNESIIYFGDTAHLPYGDKSTAAIQAYSVKICNVLLSQNCKLILIACNSASVAAYDLIKEYVGSRAVVLNVIDPVIKYLKQHYRDTNIGLIGTKRTVLSNVYKKKVDQLQQGLRLRSLATPLLVPMIEEGFFNNKLSEEIVSNYLAKTALQDIKALILGCTHYPLIRPIIDKYYQNSVTLIDSSQIVAQTVKETLTERQILHKTEEGTKAYRRFYISDYTTSFESSAKIFFGEEIELEHYPLWE